MILISNKLSNEYKDFLKFNNIDFLESIDNKNLPDEISDHPDLSVFVIDKDNLIVEESVFDYYKRNLPYKNIIKGEIVSQIYPFDSLYNVVRFKDFYIHNDHTERNIESILKNKNIQKLKVKQGYSRCSCIVFNDSILTNDYGIYNSLKDKINIILLKPEMIKLPGFSNGFIGGTFGMIDDDKALFTGNIEKLQNYEIIKREAIRENIKLIYNDLEIIDRGSILNLY